MMTPPRYGLFTRSNGPKPGIQPSSFKRSLAAGSALTLAVLIGLSGCKSEQAGQGGSPSSAPLASVVSAPKSSAELGPGGLATETIQKAVNPKGLPVYSGPTGRVVGRVKVVGDPPEDLPIENNVKAGCEGALKVHGKNFRVGEEGGLVDALVAVTEYEGYVPAPKDSVKITGKDCSWGTQTIALTFGQQIEVRSGDNRTYIPELQPSRIGIVYVAAPERESVKLTPEAPRSYRLQDQAHPVAVASVFVLNYATHAVTNEAGRFEISNIPVGKVKINALLPLTMETTSQSLEVKAGQDTEVELVITHRRGDAANDAGPFSPRQ